MRDNRQNKGKNRPRNEAQKRYSVQNGAQPNQRRYRGDERRKSRAGADRDKDTW